MNGCALPVELLKTIITYLPDEDIYSCSGTCRLWYHVANWVLKSRNSVPVYRWPEKLPDKCSSLAAIGLKSIYQVVNHCEGIQHIRLGTDDSKILPGSVLRLLLKKYVDHLKILDFLYWDIEEHHIEIILTYAQGLLLNIKLHKLEDITKTSLIMLIDSRELLGSIIVECTDSRRAIICYPDARTSTEITLPDVKSILIFCPGVNCFQLDSMVYLTSVTIKQANKLNVTTLETLSSLVTLIHFHVEDLDLEKILPRQLVNILRTGFNRLYSLGMINCKQIDNSVIESIAAKVYLRQLYVDIRYVQRPETCLNMLKSLNQLGDFKLLCIFSIINDIPPNFSKFKQDWPKLKTLSVQYYYSCMDLPFCFYRYGIFKLNERRIYQFWGS